MKIAKSVDACTRAALGPWSVVHDSQAMEHRPLSMVHSSRSMVHRGAHSNAAAGKCGRPHFVHKKMWTPTLCPHLNVDASKCKNCGQKRPHFQAKCPHLNVDEMWTPQGSHGQNVDATLSTKTEIPKARATGGSSDTWLGFTMVSRLGTRPRVQRALRHTGPLRIRDSSPRLWVRSRGARTEAVCYSRSSGEQVVLK